MPVRLSVSLYQRVFQVIHTMMFVYKKDPWDYPPKGLEFQICEILGSTPCWRSDQVFTWRSNDPA
jgi:hypothetical protein